MKRIPLLALCFAVVAGCNGNNPIDEPNTGGGSAGTGGGAAGTGGGTSSTGGGTAGTGGGSPTATDAGTDTNPPDGGSNTSDAGVGVPDAGVVMPDAGQFNPQLPPLTSAADIRLWIAQGFYKAWKCEPEKHAGRMFSPHGQNRICSNDVLSAHGAGEYPVGAVGFKELYNAAGAINGYAIEIKTKKNADVANPGAAWFWFEDLNGTNFANGEGVMGCTGCHSLAGSDALHTGHDYVYTQVK
jgi:hypothetical protein